MRSTPSHEGAPPHARSLRRRTRFALALTTAVAVGAAASPAALADDAGIPDPLKDGPYETKKVDYEAGTLLLTLPATPGGTTSIPMRGSVTYPVKANSSKIIQIIHGRHGVCYASTPATGQYVCDDTTDPDGTPTRTDIKSYGGYDYMAENLASHGYLVQSIEANVSNFDNNYSDAGANARSQIMQGHLNLLFRWKYGYGPIVPGDDSRTIGLKLVGKANFSDGLGFMGHSRGGDAVTDYIAYNRGLPAHSGTRSAACSRSRRRTTRRRSKPQLLQLHVDRRGHVPDVRRAGGERGSSVRHAPTPAERQIDVAIATHICRSAGWRR